MIGVLPSVPAWAEGVLGWIGAAAALAASLGAIGRTPPGRLVRRGIARVWRVSISRPAHEWMAEVVTGAVTPIVDARLEAKLAPVHRQLDELAREVTPNGGDSDRLGDRVRRVEEAVAGIAATQQEGTT